MKLIPEVMEQEVLMTNENFWDIKTQFLLEAGSIHAYYFEVMKSKDYFKLAQKAAHLDVSLIGTYF